MLKITAIMMGLAAVLLLTTAFTPVVRPQTLPPRPEATPPPVKEAEVRPEGAQIQLTVPDSMGSAWTQVQWQDTSNGRWYDVDGWGGQPDPANTVLWWVAKEDLGSGPFRWQLFAEEGGDLLATSDSFYLPDLAWTITQISISVTP